MLDCLYAECIPCVTDCVMAELEKLGPKYRVALKVAKVGGGQQEHTPKKLIWVHLVEPVHCELCDESMAQILSITHILGESA